MSAAQETRIVRCWHCRGMMRVAARALSVFCPHCQKRANLEDLIVTGSHPGKALMTCGDIRIEHSARLHVDVYAHRVIVLGKLWGPVIADDFVIVGSTGHVIGDIKAPRIVVQEGGRIDGRCEMTRIAAPAEGAESKSDEVADEQCHPSPFTGPRPRPLAPPRQSTPAAG